MDGTDSILELGCLGLDMSSLIDKVKRLPPSFKVIQLKNCEYSISHLRQQFELAGLKVIISSDKIITFT